MADDWRDRFRADLILSAALAGARPDRGVVLMPHADTNQLFAWHVPTGRLDRRTDLPAGLSAGWVEPTGEYLYYLHDEQGSEIGHLVRVPFDGSLDTSHPLPIPLDLTPDLPAYTLRGLGFDAMARRLVLNAVDRDGFTLFAIDLRPRPDSGDLRPDSGDLRPDSGDLRPDSGDLRPEPGQPRMLHRARWQTWGALLSATGELAACWSTARAAGVRHYTLLVFHGRTGEPVGELDDGRAASVVGVAFSPVAGDDRLLASTTASGYLRPVIWHPRTGERRDLVLADLDGDVQPLSWSAGGDQLLLCQLAGAQRLHRYDLTTDRRTALAHPPGRYYDNVGGGVGFDADGQIVGLRHVATAPPEVVVLDGGTGEARRTLLRSAPAQAGRPWRSVTFGAPDGTQVQAWLAEPDGDRPHPTILEMHGGPHWAFTETYLPAVQAWLDNGYAWMGVNYRGSVGFGAAFAERIWGGLGHWELVDTVAARAWLVEQGIARDNGVVIHGSSYGGYLTLLAMGQRPQLWAAGIAVVALGDLVAAYDEMSDALAAALAGWFGGTPSERPEAYAAASPITYAERVGAPVLVLQGRHDSRTPPNQLSRYERRMRALGKHIEVDWFDAGHQTIGPRLWVRFQERMLDFAARAVGGQLAAAGPGAPR